MSIQYSRAELHEVALTEPIAAVPRLSNRAERTFGLHPILYVTTIGAHLAFLAIMAAAFGNPGLILPFAICVIYIVMAFGTPGLWARVTGRPSGRVQSWAEFRHEGMEIETGHIGSAAAIAQVLVLPVLIVGWGAAIAVIVALT